jgi:hypothetical protein
VIALIAFCIVFVWLLRRRHRKHQAKHAFPLPFPTIGESLGTRQVTISPSTKLQQPTEKDLYNRRPPSFVYNTDEESKRHLAPLRARSPRDPASRSNSRLDPNSSWSDDNVSSWAVESLARQNAILLRENEEFWQDIEDLRRQNEELQRQNTGFVPGHVYRLSLGSGSYVFFIPGDKLTAIVCTWNVVDHRSL